MTKKVVFTAALFALMLAVGCATGGNGAGSGITVTVSDNSIPVAALNQSLAITATVSPSTANPAVNWTITGTSCTGSGNPCGSFTSTTATTATYLAPSSVPGTPAITINAVSQADGNAFAKLPLTIVPITTTVAPTPVNVGQGLVQQFTAVAFPDYVPQTFTWSCKVNGSACANFVSGASGVAVYTAQESACTTCVLISAAQSSDPTGCTVDARDCTPAKVSVVASRVSGTYAFHFSGYDSSHNPVAVAGSVTVATNGAVSGVEDELASGIHTQHTITGGSYTPSTASDNNTNNAGTLTLTTGAFPNQYAVVLDAAGDLRMIESDSHGIGSGSMEKSQTTQFTPNSAQTFVLAFSGTDSLGKRVGYAGVLPLDGAGNIAGGQVDSNDGGTANTYSNVSGAYSSVSGVWTLHFAVGSQTLHFDFYIGPGQLTHGTRTPLTLYAISTDAVDSTHPALSGRLVLQDSSVTYDKTALNSDSISHLTGVDGSGSNTLVSLIAATADSSGNLSTTFDANNAGSIVAAAAAASTCTYTAGTGGRYVMSLLGTGSSTCTGGIPFVFYASGANRGLLLDQSSAAVMTGSMDPQIGNGTFGGSGLPSTYAAASISNATSGVTPIAANLLLTFPSSNTFVVGGTEYPGPQSLTGTYNITYPGTGTITLSTPVANYVIYAIDPSHFEMIDVDATVTKASVIYAQQ